MRKVIVYVNLTFDGFQCGPNGELDWMDPNPEMNAEFADAMRARVDTMLVGGPTHEGFEAHFGASAADPASPAGLVDFAKWMLDTPKVVFSSTLPSGPVARVATDLAGEVAALKAAPGGDIVAFGGVTLVNSLVAERLVDEYWIKLCPTAIGAGRPLFPVRTPLKLIDSKAWDSGTVTLRYVPA